MKKIKVAELKAGMSFDQPVYIDPTNVLVQAREEINIRDIERLIKWGIREVETNGQVIVLEDESTNGQESQEAAASDKNNTTAVASSASTSSDKDKTRVETDYASMRKNKNAFRTMIRETVETLNTNFQALVEGKPFDNAAILKLALRISEEIGNNPYNILSTYGLKSSAGWNVFHSVHAACYGCLLGINMKYSRPKLNELTLSMLLMDCGMGRVPVHVKEKNADLNDPEWGSIKKHPLFGYQLLIKNAKVKAGLAAVCLQHHEAFDGTGYPQHLKGPQIEEFSRIASIADSYTAMLEKRSHRDAMLPYEAMKNMLSVQMSKFDPRLLRQFLGSLSIYPQGSIVEISNEKKALVIGCNPTKPLRPMLRLMRDEKDLPYKELQFLDLGTETSLYIIKAVDPESVNIDMESDI